MKVLAMYLPQFHRTKENDEWWGEGFTEWTTVKAAKPLFEGHKQPVVPYRNNYYDLTEKSVMQWQADLMKKYGIDGVCIYHYWFKDGKQVLEKPAEDLLRWTDIDMPFCFCWANETWARSWSGLINANVWTSTLEKRASDGKSILLQQSYGEETVWTEHFYYLLKFFRDDRYIKIDNKPIIMIYRPEIMPCVERMLNLWKHLAIESGFDGLYLIGGDRGECSEIHDDIFDKIIYWEPIYSIRKVTSQGHGEKKHENMVIHYEDIWESILNRRPNALKRIFGGVVGYDDTPRRGKRGMVIQGASPEKFTTYLSELLGKNKAIGNELVFINAWNEWGEGMYMEPDSDNGYGYLEAVNNAKKDYEKYVDKYMALHKQLENQYAVQAEGRYRHYFSIFEKWTDLRYKNKDLQDYFLDREYRSIAVYGYGPLAKLLISELNDSPVKVEYVIDKNAMLEDCNLPIYQLNDKIPQVDVIVITATFSSGVIFSALYKNGYHNVISLEEIIMEEW